MRKSVRFKMLYSLIYVASVLSSSLSELQSAVELQHLRSTCQLKDLTHSCNDTITTRTCSCDNLCLIYEDCCFDSRLRRYGKAVRDNSDIEKDHWQCVDMKDLGYVLMKSKCPAHWDENPDVVKSCEQKSNTGSLDPFSMMPATHRRARTTYRNVYCAVCHQVDLESLTVWVPSIKVVGLTVDAARQLNVDLEYIKNNLRYNRTAGSWTLQVKHHDGTKSVHDVNIDANPPSWYIPRHCAPNLITRCPESWKNTTVSKQCIAYQAVTYSRKSQQGYRNLQCAQCHKVSYQDLMCKPFPKPKTVIERRAESFGVLLDYSGGGQVGAKDCPSGSKYDSYHKTCKKIVCGFPWLVIKDNKCVPK